MDAKKREGRTTLFLESTVEDLMVDSFLTGRSLPHNCVQIFNIISCFISDTPWVERYSKKGEKEGKFGNTWSSIVHLVPRYQNLLHFNAHYKFSRSLLKVFPPTFHGITSSSLDQGINLPPRKKIYEREEKRLTNGNEIFSFFFFFFSFIRNKKSFRKKHEKYIVKFLNEFVLDFSFGNFF